MEHIAIEGISLLRFLVLVQEVENTTIELAHFLACVPGLALVQGFCLLVAVRRVAVDLLWTVFGNKDQGLDLVSGDASFLLQKRVFFLKIEGLLFSVPFLAQS